MESQGSYSTVTQNLGNSEETKLLNGSSLYNNTHADGINEFSLVPDSREELKVAIPSKTQQNQPKQPKCKKFDISDLRKDPELYQKILNEAIRIEKNNNKSSIFELNFQIKYESSFGEKVVITGGHEFLGN